MVLYKDTRKKIQTAVYAVFWVMFANLLILLAAWGINLMERQDYGSDGVHQVGIAEMYLWVWGVVAAVAFLVCFYSACEKAHKRIKNWSTSGPARPEPTPQQNFDALSAEEAFNIHEYRMQHDPVYREINEARERQNAIDAEFEDAY